MQSGLTIGYLFFPSKFTEFLQKLDNHTESKVHDYLEENREGIRWSSVAVLIADLLTFTTMLLCKNSVMGYRKLDDEEDELPLRGRKEPLLVESASASYLGRNAAAPPTRTPRTDAKRDALNEKYGGLFSKNTENHDEQFVYSSY